MSMLQNRFKKFRREKSKKKIRLSFMSSFESEKNQPCKKRRPSAIKNLITPQSILESMTQVSLS